MMKGSELTEDIGIALSLRDSGDMAEAFAKAYESAEGPERLTPSQVSFVRFATLAFAHEPGAIAEQLELDPAQTARFSDAIHYVQKDWLTYWPLLRAWAGWMISARRDNVAFDWNEQLKSPFSFSRIHQILRLDDGLVPAVRTVVSSEKGTELFDATLDWTDLCFMSSAFLRLLDESVAQGRDAPYASEMYLGDLGGIQV